MAEPERTFSDEMLASEEVSKKDIIKFLHENANFEVRCHSHENGSKWPQEIKYCAATLCSVLQIF